MKPGLKILLGVVIGGVLGFSYYFFIGCRTGSCPLTGNPYISTLYGSVVGLILTVGGKKSGNKGNKK